MKNLSPRLMSVASLVRKGGRVADIGTDHAYLPVYLVENGLCECALAADLRQGPLDNAKKAVEQAQLTDKIALRLSDGLSDISPDEADEIVIAGMGGILIAQIIQAAPWLQDNTKHLVLQPMTHPHVLREFLVNNGYRIIAETVCRDTGKLYCVMSAEYCGEPKTYPQYYEYYGELPACKTDLAREYLESLAYRLSRDADNMRCSDPSGAEHNYKVSDKINTLL